MLLQGSLVGLLGGSGDFVSKAINTLVGVVIVSTHGCNHVYTSTFLVP